MKAPKNEGGYDRKLVPEGTHLGICYQMIEIGKVQEEYMGESKIIHKVMLTWEIPEERIEFEKDGEKIDIPMAISKEYTFAMGEKATLRKDLTGWRGKAFEEQEAQDFELDVLLGKPCLITVIHKTSKAGKERAEVASISKIMKGMAVPPTHNKLMLLDYENWDQEVFNALPEWIQNKIKSSDNYKAMVALQSMDTPTVPQSEGYKVTPITEEIEDDDFPF